MRSSIFNIKAIISLSCLFSVIELGILSNGVSIIAQSQQLASERFFARIRQSKTRVTGQQKSHGSRDGGQENLCGIPDQSMPSLTAIIPAIPKSKDDKGSYTHYILGTTTLARPTLWFYLPYQIDRQRSAELVLREHRNGIPLHKQTVALPAQPGLYAFQLDYPLNADQVYSWRFAVTCKPGELSADDDVEGWIERIDSKVLEPAFKQAKTPIQKLDAYANQGIWHESMAVLTGEVCRQDRKLAQQHLNDLIREIGLTDIVEKTPQPLLTKCQPLSSP